MWLSGAIIGTARITGTSPFGVGDDRTVGLATVCLIGGELAGGAVQLLKDKRAGFLAAVRNQTPIMSRQADAVYPAAISVDDPGLRGQYVKLAHWYLGRRRPSS